MQMSKQSSRKPSPSTVRPPSPRIADPRKHSPRAVVPASRNRKSPSLFEPSSSFTDRVGFNGSSGQQQNVKPKPFRSLGLLDDIDLLSQSAYFDEADSEIQSIYERVVKDSTVQNSLQEIIAAQKLQAAYANSHTHTQQSSSPPQSSALNSTGSYPRNMSSSSSSFFAPTSHFSAPPVPHTHSSSSHPARSRESAMCDKDKEKEKGMVGMGMGDAVRASLDEDQKSDNTTHAGYMVVENTNDMDSATSFQDFVLPQPETMSDDALIALVEFAHREMSKRNNPSKDPQSSTGAGAGRVHEKRRSSPANIVQTIAGKSAAGKASSHTQRRPRSKSGGSESAVTGREDHSMPRPLCQGGQAIGEEYYEVAYSHVEDDCISSDSGRVRPVEKMLGLTPGYLRKPSPANSPGNFHSHLATTPKGNRASPWLVFDPPHAQESYSPHTHMGKQSNSPIHATSPSRTFSSSSPICIGSNGTGQGSGGPIRLPAKKVTSVPVTLFSPEEHGEMRRKGDYFNSGRHEDDDSQSFVSVSSSMGSVSGPSRGRVGSRALQHQLQHLVISPRTAFDDISVSSSEGSSSNKGYNNGYRKPPVPGAGAGGSNGNKQKR